jgi:hypothetical protein
MIWVVASYATKKSGIYTREVPVYLNLVSRKYRIAQP